MPYTETEKNYIVNAQGDYECRKQISSIQIIFVVKLFINIFVCVLPCLTKINVICYNGIAGFFNKPRDCVCCSAPLASCS